MMKTKTKIKLKIFQKLQLKLKLKNKSKRKSHWLMAPHFNKKLRIFDLAQNWNLWIDDQKFDTDYYVHETTPVQNLAKICTRGLLDKWLKYNILWLFLKLADFDA